MGPVVRIGELRLPIRRPTSRQISSAANSPKKTRFG